MTGHDLSSTLLARGKDIYLRRHVIFPIANLDLPDTMSSQIGRTPSRGAVCVGEGHCARVANDANGCHDARVERDNLKNEDRDKDRWTSRMLGPYDRMFSIMPNRKLCPNWTRCVSASGGSWRFQIGHRRERPYPRRVGRAGLAARHSNSSGRRRAAGWPNEENGVLCFFFRQGLQQRSVRRYIMRKKALDWWRIGPLRSGRRLTRKGGRQR